MSECRRIQKNLVAFLQGELGEAEKEKVSRHLKICSRCGRELKALQQTFQNADGLRPELEQALAGVDWEAQAEKIVASVWKERELPRPAARRERDFLFRPKLGPVLAGLVGGITIGALAMFMIFRGSILQKKGGERLFAPGEFLDRVDVEIARRATLDYLEKSQYVLLELAQSASERGTVRLSEAAARETKELLTKKRFLNPQLEKARMAKAKDICDQIELLFYELSRISESLTEAKRQEIQNLVEQKKLLLKIKLVKKELQESEV